MPKQPQPAWPPSSTSSIDAMTATAPTAQPIPYGYMPHNAPQGHMEQQQATEAQRRHTYFASKGLDANVLMPVRRLPRQVQEQVDGVALAAPSMTPTPTEPAESEVLASPSKKRGKRMICATCKNDAPVTKDNDGVNCTRCLRKLRKTYGMQYSRYNEVYRC